MAASSDDRGSSARSGVQVLALLRERRARVRLQRAVGAEHWIAFADGWSRLYEAARRLPVSLFVLDPRDEAGRIQTDSVERLVRARPSVAVLLYLPFGPDVAHPLLRWARLGVRHVVFLDVGDSGAYLREMVGRAAARSATETLWAQVRGALGPLAPGIAAALHAGLHGVSEIRSADEWAEAVGVPLRTFYRAFRSRGLPPPKRCLEWLRFLHVLHRLTDPGVELDEVIGPLGGLPSERRRRAWAAEWGVEPSELWYTVPLDEAIRRFARECGRDAVARPAAPEAVHR